jgi:hypothetical protein
VNLVDLLMWIVPPWLSLAATVDVFRIRRKSDECDGFGLDMCTCSVCSVDPDVPESLLLAASSVILPFTVWYVESTFFCTISVAVCVTITPVTCYAVFVRNRNARRMRIVEEVMNV